MIQDPSLFIMKPVLGCNLACKYCYMGYGDKRDITVMNYSLLEKVMVDISSLGLSQIEFNWHGGEPLLAGIEFFYKVVKYQKKYFSSNCKVKNSLQTNGTLLDKNWINFLDDNSIGVGISLDGPEDIHNNARSYKDGRGSFSNVMKGISYLRKSKSNNNRIHALPVISKKSLNHADRIFSFFVDNEIFSFAFTPCFPKRDGLVTDKIDNGSYITSKDFANFMTEICTIWFKLDNNKVEIRFLSEILRMLLGGESRLCIFQKASCCSRFITIDALGNVYPCDCYMSSKFALGNVANMDLNKMITSHQHKSFSNRVARLPSKCKYCDIFNVCSGGCSYYRYFTKKTFLNANYYCSAIKTIVQSMQLTLQTSKGGIRNEEQNELSP